MLSDSDSDADALHTLTINEHFAKAFEYKKEREELAKLREKYGSDHSDADFSEDSDDTEEDSDGEELTPAVDAAILRTLSRIRKKDPAIYEGGRQVFDEEHTRTQDRVPVVKPKMKERSKPLTIREAALASALADDGAHSRSPSPDPLTHTEEQELLRSETRAAFHGALDSEGQEDDDDDDLLIPRARTRDEIEVEEEEYKAFLEREVGEDLRNFVGVDTNEVAGASEDVEIVGEDKRSDGKKKKKGKREREKEKESNREKDEAQGKKVMKHDKKSKEEVDREFLMNYIFNRGWIDHSNRRVPTYREIVGSSSKQPKQKPTKSKAESNIDQKSDDDGKDTEEAAFSDEDSFDDLADAFETSYNFRFEEPDGALITSFPRNLTSARRESTTRKDARTRKKERQEAEKQGLLEARREEIRRERTLIEAAVAEEDQNDALLVENSTSDKKKSKRQQRKEELARLKALKANELRRRLEMVSSEGGLGGLGDEALVHLDLDADWDPSRHDAQMAELYGDEGIVGDGDAEKPVWDDDINIGDIVPPQNTQLKTELKKQRKKEKKKNKKVEDGDVGVNVDEMDADFDTGQTLGENDEEWRGTEEERKRKVDAYMDEVVNRLGFSGITSHMPTRFHYTSVASENYGLTPTEILLATDAELNSYVGLKKLAPYRIDRGSKGKKVWDPKRTESLKEFRESLNSRVGSHYEGPWSLGGGTNTKSRAAEAQGEKKRMGRKERAKLKAMQGGKDNEGPGAMNANVQLEAADKSQKRKPGPDVSLHVSHPGQAERDVEDGVPKKKRRRRHKKGSGGAGGAETVCVS